MADPNPGPKRLKVVLKLPPRKDLAPSTSLNGENDGKRVVKKVRPSPNNPPQLSYLVLSGHLPGGSLTRSV
jgi:hypothetical protein